MRSISGRVQVGVVSLVVVLVLLPEIHAAGQFAYAKEVCPVHQFGAKGRFMQQAFESLHRAYVGEQSQLLPHGQQPLFRTHLGRRVVVELGVSDSREQHGIRLLADLESLFRERVAHLVDGIRSAKSIFVTHFMSEFPANGSHDIDSLHGYFRSDTIARQYSNFKIHFLSCFVYFICYNRFLSCSASSSSP